MNLVDTHSHIYGEEFAEDRAEVIERLKANHVTRVYFPNIDSTSIEDMHKMEAMEPDLFRCMMGLHPTSVAENYKEELDIVAQWLDKRQYVGIGEIGIDLYWDDKFKKEQIEVFETQMQMSIEKNLPIIIHSRNAFEEIVTSIRKFPKGSLRGIFHSFGGTKEEADVIFSLGDFKLGINGIITFKNSTLGNVVKDIPNNKIVLETDSPYLTPVPFRGKRNESSFILYTAQKIAELKGLSLEMIGNITKANAEEVFSP
ncbi:MAG TPA: TatD family hydrolase [Paludibacteraceae bacterium]|jgi:TatD DNase family protein|nr:TatD family hydrolase [Paludibacteraceae bacterium]HOU68400.1 TatD family hydrolase [Paludibacteraceae bacterium]HPH62206.1 TatD family hydrolase [Paludibacteraceae bacterium]HQF50262.1 TatD family hydrolase [Paludibacteraceae bacterium]